MLVKSDTFADTNRFLITIPRADEEVSSWAEHEKLHTSSRRRLYYQLLWLLDEKTISSEFCQCSRCRVSLDYFRSQKRDSSIVQCMRTTISALDITGHGARWVSITTHVLCAFVQPLHDEFALASSGSSTKPFDFFLLFYCGIAQALLARIAHRPNERREWK